MTTTVSLIKILEDKTFIAIEQGSWRWQNIYLHNKNICQINKMNIFPKNRKRKNVVPVYEKGDEQVINNY